MLRGPASCFARLTSQLPVDESPEPLSIPWWIWITLTVVLIGGIIVFVLKYQNTDDEQYRAYRDDGSSRRRRRHRSRSRHRHRGHRGDKLDE
jgi:hypothetical protein